MRHLPLAICTLATSGCAMNLAELKSPRVLRGGEVELVYGNNAILPSSGVRQVVESSVALADDNQSGEGLQQSQKETLVAGAAALSLASPGYGSFFEANLGLGYGFDASARVGNGIGGLGLRRRLVAQHPWHLTLGARADWNTGGSWLGPIDTVGQLVKVTDMRRADLGATLHGGVELGEWGQAWGGLKVVDSPYRLNIDATLIDLGQQQERGHIVHAGGFVGAAVGFRWVYLSGELMLLRSWGELEIYDQPLSLTGWTLVPGWGVKGRF